MRPLRSLAPALLAWSALTLLAAGCPHHGYGDGRHVDHIAAKISKKLQLNPSQQLAFNALVSDLKTHLQQKAEQRHQALLALKQDAGQPTLDVGQVAALLKAQVAARDSNDTIDAFIDRVAAFYQTLDPNQQQLATRMIADHLDWVE